MRVFLGVDGGTSKTDALVATEDGTVLGFARGAGSNIYAIDPGLAISHAVAAVADALRQAGLHGPDISVAAFSMCGADWPEDFDLFRAAMRGAGFGQQVVVTNDAVGGLRAGSPDGTGVAVVCGTGVATAGRNQRGETWHSGFWGESGGALDLAHRALRAVYRADLGIDPPTRLTDAIRHHTGMHDVEQILHTATSRSTVGEIDVATIAPVLLTVAHNGDAAARRIVEANGAELGDYALAAARKVGIEHTPFHLVLAGSIFLHPSTMLADSIAARVQSVAPQATVRHSEFPPVVGALFLAHDEAGIAVTGPLRQTVRTTMAQRMKAAIAR